MKVLLVVLGAVFLLATGRLVYKTSQAIDNEMQSYVANLHYDFTAQVDSIAFLNTKRDTGFLVCKLTRGDCERNIEDSINNHLADHKWIRFLHFKEDGRILIFRGGLSKYVNADSVQVNSDRDYLAVFRNGESILTTKISLSTVHKVSFAFWIPD